MKIALVILHADPARGGAERYTLDLAHALIARGHELSLIATRFGNETAGQQVPIDATAPTRLGQYLKFLDGLDRHLASNRYDIVHAMLPVRKADIYHPHAGLAAEAVVSGHTKYDGLQRSIAAVANRFNLKRQRFAAVERQWLDSPEPPVVLCLSEYVKATVRKHYALPSEKLATLFNAVDLDKFNPSTRPTAGNDVRQTFGIRRDQIVALMIAQDFHRKGLSEAISALSPDASRLVLLVVGKENPAHYERLAESLKVRGQVVFAGPTRDPYAFYRAADFFVLPTRHDPCSLVVLESLAMGVPVISSAMNGACEIMVDGKHGFVLPDPRDVRALRGCYLKLMDDSARQQMVDQCIAMRTQLSQDHHVEQLLAIYDNILRNRSVHAAK